MRLSIKQFLNRLVSPIYQNEDKARREFILNVLLLTIIGSSLIAFFVNLIKEMMGIYVALSAKAIFIIFVLFIFLYFLSRKGLFILVSHIFLSIFFLSSFYVAFKYGIDIPESLLMHSLVIIISGALISTRFAFFVASIIVIVISLIGYLQINLILLPQLYWREEMLNVANIIMISTIFFVTAIVSWLSNREIERSLARVRRSEAELREERDLLEVKVEERTQELKETQAEKMAQLYRFAEFGRISAGLFHDLINPLNAVSLNMEQVKNGNSALFETQIYIKRAITAARKMEDLIVAVRKQLERQGNKAVFSLNEEIEYVIDVLSYKALKANVKLNFSSSRDIKIFGDAVKFNQVALNLIANAIDALASIDKSRKEVTVSLDEGGGRIILSVKDRGAGIPEENIRKIFEPFFTTKIKENGIGIGLSIVKRIVEKDFGGSIDVISKVGGGSVFTVQFPYKKNDEKSL